MPFSTSPPSTQRVTAQQPGGRDGTLRSAARRLLTALLAAVMIPGLALHAAPAQAAPVPPPISITTPAQGEQILLPVGGTMALDAQGTAVFGQVYVDIVRLVDGGQVLQQTVPVVDGVWSVHTPQLGVGDYDLRVWNGGVVDVVHTFSIQNIFGSRPSIRGSRSVGSVLTAAVGIWQPGGVQLKYQWYRASHRGGDAPDDRAIPGATGRSYRLTAADRGKWISVQVIGELPAGGPMLSRMSAKTGAVAAGRLSIGHPKLRGTAKVGKTLRVKVGKWQPSGVKFSYRWTRNGKKIGGAAKASYRLREKDRGAKIRVKVIGKLNGYATASRTSSAKRIR